MEPRQLDISDEGDMFIAYFGNNLVQILDGNLEHKSHISHHSMLKPRDVKLTPDVRRYSRTIHLLHSHFHSHN